jgi:hypothetical protein
MRRLPKIGRLIRLKHYTLTTGVVIIGSCDNLREIEVPTSTIALVIGHMNRGDPTNKNFVPVVMVNEFKGWIFDDEWEPII